ncbi:hypothetical protein ACLSU7_01480 [Bdellovibrio sp. HCB185ZH]|uniref:hypothetical protein n=1 Tax=Bdellovibrio sp. HCB185ZH TaxID=3394235 RepID=UPI0039A5BE39
MPAPEIIELKKIPTQSTPPQISARQMKSATPHKARAVSLKLPHEIIIKDASFSRQMAKICL